MGNRQCAVQIHNNSNNYVMCSPMVHLHSGRCQTALTPTIAPSEGGSALFTKTPGTARGSVGVFTYDIYNGSTKTVVKMAVMFSNPFNFDFDSNLFAVGIFNRKQPCDDNLFSKMCYTEGPDFVRSHAGSDLFFERDGVKISANMTDTKEPKLDIKVSSRDG